MMPLERPVFWHQGLSLQPQHFQLAERSFLSHFVPYRNHLVPHFWGVCRMEIRSGAPAGRSVEIASGAFLFPDGTYAVLLENASVQPRLVPQELPVGATPLTVYLGLRKWHAAAANVTTLDEGALLSRVATRFSAPAGGAACADLHGGGAPGEVRQLTLVLQIFWESEADLAGDYLLMPVGRLEKKGDGVCLSPQFAPPCLTLAGSPLLSSLVREIRDRLALRCRSLEACKRERGIESASFGSKDLVFLLALRTLNRGLAELSYLLDAGEVHPWQVYGLLGQLVAELSTFSEAVTALGEAAADGTKLLPDYRHLDLHCCFSQARDLIIELLDRITAGPDYALRLSFDGNWYATELTPAHLEGRNLFFLVLKTGEDHKRTVGSIATVGKLSCKERVPLLIAQALPGIPLEHLPEPPRELPRDARSIFFTIDRENDQWELVRKWNNLALSWDQAPADLEARVMILARP